MRIIIHLCTIAALLFGFYFAYTFKEPRNGMLMIGEKEALQDIKNQHNADINSVDISKVKTMKNEGQSVFIMDQKTAQDVSKKGVLRKSDNDRGGASSDPIDSLPTMINDEAILFSDNKNEKLKKMVLGDREIQIRYDSNTWLGHSRNSEYEDIILIVNPSTFHQIPLQDTYIGIFELNKVYGNNHGIVDMYDRQSVQLEEEFTKLTKSKTNSAQLLEGLSILK
ncbi:lipoprotein BA_5634 family protein [Paenibacillus thiaminolyticus]|uniref:Lipoprotein BA_5634 family protein n=1 Tax=Paenibacillus thiaminolyticus TaxID=49283 RepID=A0AAP9IZU8_PANTH|nr:lipoprotein BA_5634 family protein [Paenibacillus thiaminolyticus]MCY9534809.1 lipoprotein BA_5634 family protein [Paenibacillus thiaminolyticus]MCY9603934.1 lipoprotein BA_5634 family protein [Paenibacillus thiaminolyticus]MCY9606838.1 lipoprotein BA_5634 family protein [Paenibacillus thiaminolyticus]MCY9615830.1 lipoprotein BA_5634 family protein [Paenibacillus thiaminolyticus]MCY9619064.1 lipoprotein BA_5634 family protein [Paenibacillus thiaminolyticus]